MKNDELVAFLNTHIQKKEDLIERYMRVGEKIEEINKPLINLKNQTNIFFKKNNFPIGMLYRGRELKMIGSQKKYINGNLFWIDKLKKGATVKFPNIINLLKENNYSLDLLEFVQQIEITKESIVNQKPSLVTEITNINKLFLAFDEIQPNFKSSEWFLNTGF